jgi:alpha-L-fucosidase
LVCPRDVHSGQFSVQLPRQNLHPSQFGYKDICHIWRAENWNPAELIRLYARTGAKYFVALANHHGNFDCWDSKYQPWNCVNVGPGKDIVGTWEKVARAQGLRFGITVHGTPGRVWKQFMPVRYGSDATGPLKGVPYDGVLTKADGRGKWWEGMDPQQLNGRPHGKDEPCPEFVENFMFRTQDLIDKYNPDLLYFDDNLDWWFDAGAPGGRELNVWLGMPELHPISWRTTTTPTSAGTRANWTRSSISKTFPARC